jgi:hypothetical protein
MYSWLLCGCSIDSPRRGSYFCQFAGPRDDRSLGSCLMEVFDAAYHYTLIFHLLGISFFSLAVTLSPSTLM